MKRDLALGPAPAWVDARYDVVPRVIVPWTSKVDGKVVSTWETMAISWADVHRLLGRRYDGPQDDPLIISRLQELGIAPAWLDDADTEIKATVYCWEAVSPEWPA